MMSINKPRPYWHVDAKWITGLLLVVVLNAALLIFSLVQVTAKGPAVNTLSTMLAVMLSPAGLDDATDITILRQRLQASPNKSLQVIPWLRITIQEKDLAGLSPREARLFLMRLLAEPIYDGGSQGLAALVDDPEIRANILAGGAPLDVFTLKTHETLQRVALIPALIFLALLVPLILFSYRFGRIGSPGCVLFAACLPGALVSGFLSTIKPPGAVVAPAPDAGAQAVVSYMASLIIPSLAEIAAHTYWIVLALGFGLMLLALGSNLLWWLVRGRKTAV